MQAGARVDLQRDALRARGTPLQSGALTVAPPETVAICAAALHGMQWRMHQRQSIAAAERVIQQLSVLLAERSR